MIQRCGLKTEPTLCDNDNKGVFCDKIFYENKPLSIYTLFNAKTLDYWFDSQAFHFDFCIVQYALYVK